MIIQTCGSFLTVRAFELHAPDHLCLTLHFEVPVKGKEHITLYKRAVLNEQPTENVLKWAV